MPDSPDFIDGGTLDLSSFKASGFIAGGKIFEFERDESGEICGSHQVEQMSGDAPWGTWVIEVSDVEDS